MAYTNDVNSIKEKEVRKINPTPFILTLIVGDKLLHNNMINSRASTAVMSKQVADALNLSTNPLKRELCNSMERNY